MKSIPFLCFLVDIFLMMFALLVFSFGDVYLSGFVVFLLVMFTLFAFDLSESEDKSEDESRLEGDDE